MSRFLKNNTKDQIAIGDLPHLPTLEPGSRIDASLYCEDHCLDNSKDLKKLHASGKVVDSERAKREKKEAETEATIKSLSMSIASMVSSSVSSKEEKKVEQKPIDVVLPPIIREFNISSFRAAGQHFGYQIINYNIPNVWNETQGEDIVIAVLDTGVDLAHEDLVGRFVDNHPQDVIDRHGHGSHCAGTITANNNDKGIVGVAPKALVRAIKVLGDDGRGTSKMVADGILKAVEEGVDIISMSLGAPVDMPDIHEAIKVAYKANIPIICAAGNSGAIGDLSYPANYPETISVGALNKDNLRAWFSQGGPNLDFMAPGVSILSTTPGGYSVYSGTSMATPYIAGVVALMISKHRKVGGKTPVTNVEHVREHLKEISIDLATVGRDFETGFGLIDVEKAIKSIKGVQSIPEVIVSSCQLDAPGQDRKNLSEEWIEFQNISMFDLDMTNWKVKDKANWEFTMPKFILKAGQTFKLRTSKGQDDERNIYWGYKRPIWNNDGDTVILFDDVGNMILEYSIKKTV